MTHPLDGLDPTPAELDALIDVLAEVNAGDYPPDGEDYGPWDDQLPAVPAPTEAELASLAMALDEVYSLDLSSWDPDPDGDYADLAYGGQDQLAQIGGMIDLAHATELARQAEDAAPLPRKAEDRLAHLLDRATRGTYTPPAYFRTDLANGEPSYGCGTVDEFGRCSSRFHDALCFETVRGSVATGNEEAAFQWRGALLSNVQSATELANAHRYTEGVDDWLASPEPSGSETLAYMRQVLGIRDSSRTPQPMRPAGSYLDSLGLG